MKFCAYCGAKLDDDARFCLNCGKKCIDVTDEEESPSLEEQKRLEEENKEKERLAKEEAERLEQARLAEEARLKAEEEAKLKAEEEARLEAERLEKERQEAERLEQERLEAERKAKEEEARKEQERFEQERLEQERIAALEAEKQRLLQEKEEADRLAKEEEERLQKENSESQKVSDLEKEIATLKAQLAESKKKNKPVRDTTFSLEEDNDYQKAEIVEEQQGRDNFVLPILGLVLSIGASISYLLLKNAFSMTIILLGVAGALTLFGFVSSIVLMAKKSMSKSTKWVCLITLLCCIGMAILLLISYTSKFPGGGN